MSKFFTSVVRKGAALLHRGYENGRPFKEEVKYQPFLFRPSKDPNTKYQTLDGSPVERIDFKSIWDQKDWIKEYEGVDNWKFYGSQNHVTTFVYETYPGEIKFDPSLIQEAIIDIECDGLINGSDYMDRAPDPIVSIALKLKNHTLAFGMKDFVAPPGVKYFKCKDEAVLLDTFLTIWEKAGIDVMSGWNCIPLGSSVWGKREITSIETAMSELFDSRLVAKSPVSSKECFSVNLANGLKIAASKDHRIPVRICPKERYTDLNLNRKSKNFLEDVDLTVEELSRLDGYEAFVQVPLGNNENVDSADYSDDQLYMAGFVFTDGSLKDRQHPSYGYNVYQSELSLLESFDDFGVETKLFGNRIKGFGRYINPKFVGKAHGLIYQGTEKKLNLNSLSKLSKRQFFVFFGGMLDGDGCVQGTQISLCNYDGNLDIIAELLQWNGVFATITDNMVRLIDYPSELLHMRKKSRFEATANTCLDRDSSQKVSQTRFKKIGNSYFVRVTSVESLGYHCDMMDIETDSHYFITKGVRVHNCEGFDIPYLVNRINNVLGPTHSPRLSPWGYLIPKAVPDKFGRVKNTFDIPGIAVLDYQEIYKKFTIQVHGLLESYSLNFVSYFELGQEKIDYSEYGTLKELYEKDFQKFITYNFMDCELVRRLDDKRRFFELIYEMSYIAKCQYQDVLKTIPVWESLIHAYLLDRRIVMPTRKRQSEHLKIPGGFVKEPNPGLYKWVLSFDVTSMYPFRIIESNISPETQVSKGMLMKMLNEEKHE